MSRKFDTFLIKKIFISIGNALFFCKIIEKYLDKLNKKIYYDLKINKICENIANKYSFKYDLNNIYLDCYMEE